MKYILLSNDSKIAEYAENCGVHRIMVDLETVGKEERQGHLDTVFSRHTLEDVQKVRQAISTSKLLVRVNPINPDSRREIETVINYGADILMLPMFRSSGEVKIFLECVAGRAQTMLLLETPQALVRIDEILDNQGIDEVFIGLNDLHLGFNLSFMFELLSGGIVEYLSDKLRKREIPFGFGGIARLGTGAIDASLILSEHYRLGSQSVILSRSFHSKSKSLEELQSQLDLSAEIIKLDEYLESLTRASNSLLEANRKQLCVLTRQLVEEISS